MMLQLIEGQGLPTDCWPHIHLFVDRDELWSSQFERPMVSTLSSPAIVGFLDQNITTTWQSTQIPPP